MAITRLAPYGAPGDAGPAFTAKTPAAPDIAVRSHTGIGVTLSVSIQSLLLLVGRYLLP